uniref:SAE2 domain-containing protein n=1 Tax=Syphacia muris TaxID=451379 RepID=A0A0N5AB21_9BILA
MTSSEDIERDFDVVVTDEGKDCCDVASKSAVISKSCDTTGFEATTLNKENHASTLSLFPKQYSPQLKSPFFLPPTPPLPKQSGSSVCRSHSTSYSSKCHAEQLLSVIRSPSFLSDYDRVQEVNTSSLDNCIVRRKNERKLLHGFECPCCSQYYDALGLDPVERQHRIDQVSRHRYINSVPKTPENYWEVKMADRDEQMRRGQIVETNSPIGLKPLENLTLFILCAFDLQACDILSGTFCTSKPHC